MVITIDQVLEKIGGHGRFQYILLFCMCYIYMTTVAYHVMVIAFIAGEPTWECVRNSTVCNLTEPVTTVSKHYTERCSMLRSEWKFSDTYTSTVTEYDLVCGDSILQSVASSLYWVGWLIGNILIGYFSDKFGRSKALQLSTVLVFLFTWVIIWPKAFWVFMVCRLLTGFGSGGACMCCFIILVEFSVSKRRGISGSSLWLSGTAIYSAIPLFAYFIRDWRYLMLVGALMATPVMAFVWFIPESPRYLLVHGKYEEAREVLRQVASWNKKDMPEEDIFIPKQASDEKSDFRDLFYNKTISLITLTTWLSWFSCALMFYAVSYGSVYLGGNIYLSFFLTNIILVPSSISALIGINKFSRKGLTVFGLVIAALSSVITASIPADRSNTGFTAGRIISAMAGKFFIYIAFVTIYAQGAEVFPTTVRNIAMGTSSACGRVGSFIALYIIWLERIYSLLPHAILGILCLLSGIACYVFLPETKEIITLEVLATTSDEEGNKIEMEEKLIEKPISCNP